MIIMCRIPGIFKIPVLEILSLIKCNLTHQITRRLVSPYRFIHLLWHLKHPHTLASLPSQSPHTHPSPVRIRWAENVDGWLDVSTEYMKTMLMYPMLLERFSGYASRGTSNPKVNCQSQTAWSTVCCYAVSQLEMCHLN